MRPGDAVRATERGSHRHRLHGSSVVVLVVGCIVVAALSWTSFTVNDRNETRLLKLQTKQAASVLAVILPVVETPLAAAAEIAATTQGKPAPFARYIGPYVGAQGTFVSVSLWRIDQPAPGRLAFVGETPKLTPTSAAARSLLSEARRTRLLTLIGLLGGPEPRLGYAYMPAGSTPRYAVYAESPLPSNRRVVAEAGSAFADLTYALYLGDSARSGALLESTTPRLPITGRTATVRIPFGGGSFTLVASPTGELGGSLSARLPWIVAVVGTVLALAAAVTADRLIRRRRDAERLADENVRLYGEQRTIAETLQHALLPQELPMIPGMDIAVRYVPGVNGVDIGGDWYDIVPLDAHRFIFVVGDVSGRGRNAARIMASLHYAIRAYAQQGDAPDMILNKTSRLLSVVRDGHFATVVCGLVDNVRGVVTLANAGHLPPLMLDRDGGTAGFVSTHVGAPIGVASDEPYVSVEIAAPAGGSLLAFTDGLVERRGEILDRGLSGLEDAAVGEDEASLDDLLSKIVNELNSDASDDDTAILGLRWLN